VTTRHAPIARGSGPTPDLSRVARRADGQETPNGHGIDLHPESPADWPLLPVRVEQGEVFADLFSWSRMVARLASEWEDLGEPVDADVSFCLDRARAALTVPAYDGWVHLGPVLVEVGGTDRLVAVRWLEHLWRGSAASAQPTAYPLHRLPVAVPYGEAHVPYPSTEPPADHWDAEGQCRDPHCHYPNHPTADQEEAR